MFLHCILLEKSWQKIVKGWGHQQGKKRGKGEIHISVEDFHPCYNKKIA